LPNFYATRTTVHYEETPPFEKGDAKITYRPLHIADTVKDTALYRNGYEIAESDTLRNKKRKVDEPCGLTYGTFGPLLRGAMDAIVLAPGGLSRRRWEQGAGKPLAIFGYKIPEEKPSYDTGGCCLPDGDGTSAFEKRAGYHGEIAIDPMTGAILRQGQPTALDAQESMQPIAPPATLSQQLRSKSEVRAASPDTRRSPVATRAGGTKRVLGNLGESSRCVCRRCSHRSQSYSLSKAVDFCASVT
jgi:hypothetical protein